MSAVRPHGSSLPGDRLEVDAVADGLVVTARSSDGLVEAVEHPGHPWLVGVQWHPEMSHAGDPAAAALFADFVRACEG